MTGAYKPLSLKELYALPIPKIDYAVEGLLPLGSSTLFSAREKSGKGLISIDLLAAVALDEPFLGRAVKSGPVVYCPAEESIRLVRDRVQNRLGGATDASFYIQRLDGSTDDRLDLEQADTIRALDAMMAEIGPVVIVLDTLRELHRGREDTSDDMAPLLKLFRQLAQKHNCAVVVNHHMNKMGGSRGSTAIPAAFDQVIDFARDDTGDSTMSGMMRIEGRDVPRTMIRIKYGAQGKWTVTDDSVSVIEGDARARILKLLPLHPSGLTSDQIATEIGVEKKTVQNLMSAMKKERPMRLAVLSVGKKNAPAVYGAIQARMIPPDPFAPRDREGGMNLEMAPDSSGNVGTNDGMNGEGSWGQPSAPESTSLRDAARSNYDLAPGHVDLSPENPLGDVMGTAALIAKMTPEEQDGYRAEVEAAVLENPEDPTDRDIDTLHDRAALALFDRMIREAESMKQVGERMSQVGRRNSEAAAPVLLHSSIERLRSGDLGVPA